MPWVEQYSSDRIRALAFPVQISASLARNSWRDNFFIAAAVVVRKRDHAVDALGEHGPDAERFGDFVGEDDAAGAEAHQRHGERRAHRRGSGRHAVQQVPRDRRGRLALKPGIQGFTA